MVREDGLVPLDRTGDRPRIGVEQKLVDVVPQTFLRIPGPVDAQAVPGSVAQAVDEPVEDVSGPATESGAGDLVVRLVHDDYRDRIGRFGVDGDIGLPIGPQRDAERIRHGCRRTRGGGAVGGGLRCGHRPYLPSSVPTHTCGHGSSRVESLTVPPRLSGAHVPDQGVQRYAVVDTLVAIAGEAVSGVHLDEIAR